MKSLKLSVVFIMLCMITGISFCENIIGVVDVIPLLIFHPFMENYVPARDRFIKLPNNVDIDKMSFDERKNLFAKMEKDWLANAQARMADLGKLETQTTDQHLKFENAMKEYQKDLLELQNKKAAIGNKEFLNKYKQLEFKLWSVKKDVDKELESISSRYQKLKEEVAGKFYYEGEEHKQRVNQILDDIAQGIKSAIQNYKLNFVFNNSFSLDPFVDADNGKDHMKELLAIRYKKHRGTEEVFGKNSVGSLLSRSISGNNGFMNEITTRYMDMENYLKLFSNSFYLKTSLIYGGRDVTLYVMNYIFKKYSVDAAKRKAYINAFKELYQKRMLGGNQ